MVQNKIASFYGGKRVLVPGGEGFVGVALCRQLRNAGATVFSVDNQSRGRNRIEGVTYLVGDATNASTCRYAMMGCNSSRWGTPVDVVFNLAASVAGVLHNMNHHLDMFHENIGLQTVPMMVAEELGIPIFMQTSSVCAYSDEVNHPSREDDLGSEPNAANYGYAWSKRMGEKLASVSQLAKVVTVRPSNIFGRFDYFDERAHVIPAFIKRCFNGEDAFDLYGPGEYVREFIYSEDVASGMMVAAAFGEHKQAYNIGTNGETRITMLGLAQLVMEKAGVIKQIVHHPGKGGGDPLRWSNSEKLQSLGWRHRWTLDRGLEETIAWYKNQRNI